MSTKLDQQSLAAAYEFKRRAGPGSQGESGEVRKERLKNLISGRPAAVEVASPIEEEYDDSDDFLFQDDEPPAPPSRKERLMKILAENGPKIPRK